jgi:hypothetical protein
VIDLKPIRPILLLCSCQLRCGLLGQGEEESSVLVPEGICSSAFLQALPGVLPDRL